MSINHHPEKVLYRFNTHKNQAIVLKKGLLVPDIKSEINIKRENYKLSSFDEFWVFYTDDK